MIWGFLFFASVVAILVFLGGFMTCDIRYQGTPPQCVNWLYYGLLAGLIAWWSFRMLFRPGREQGIQKMLEELNLAWLYELTLRKEQEKKQKEEQQKELDQRVTDILQSTYAKQQQLQQKYSNLTSHELAQKLRQSLERLYLNQRQRDEIDRLVSEYEKTYLPISDLDPRGFDELRSKFFQKCIPFDEDDHLALQTLTARRIKEGYKGYQELLPLPALTEKEKNDLWQSSNAQRVIDELTKELQMLLASLRQGAVSLGTIENTTTDLWQFRQKRLQHTYILGSTGSGKTTLLKHLILQDFEQGNGLAVLAPDDQLFRDDLLPLIPARRLSETVYFNPEEKERPIPFNPLHIEPYEDIDQRVADTLTIFKRAVGDTTPRMDAILRNTFYALMRRKGSTLLDIPRLLSRKDPSLRKEILRDPTQDELTVQFFDEIYSTYPRDAHIPLINRLDALIRPLPLRRMLCHPSESFNFRQAIDHHHVLLFNLSDQVLGEANSHLLGQLLISKLQQAVFARADIPEARRTPFYLYVDEFQHFTQTASQTFADILTRARKFKLGLVFAHQNIDQIGKPLFKTIISNAQTVVCFNVSDDDAKTIVSELIIEGIHGSTPTDVRQGYVNRVKSFAKGQALVQIANRHFFIQVPWPSLPPSQTAQQVIESSKARFGAVFREPERKTRPDYPTTFEEE